MAGFKKGIKQGIYTPINESKWIITKTFDMKEPCIKYRSSWELMFCKFADFNNNIIKVNSEGMKVQYQNPFTNKMANYYLDFMMETKNGKIWLIEIKPYAQTQPPKPPRSNAKNPQKAQQNFVKAIETYAINCAKWEATEIVCAEKGWVFKIITEKELGL